MPNISQASRSSKPAEGQSPVTVPNSWWEGIWLATRIVYADPLLDLALLEIDGFALTRRWSTLVNPGSPIPGAIQALTGITQSMVDAAPRFAQLAGIGYVVPGAVIAIGVMTLGGALTDLSGIIVGIAAPVALAVFLAATGVVSIATGVLPRWLGWVRSS